MSRLLKNTTASFAFRVFSMGLGFVSIPILVRAVGPAGYGIILLSETVMGYFGVLNAGVPAGTVKYVAQFDSAGDRAMVRRVIATSFGFYLGAGLLAAVAVAAFALLGGVGVFNVGAELEDAARNVLLIAAAMSLVSWPLSTLDQVLEGLQRFPENKFALGVGSVASKVAGIVAALAGAPPAGIVACISAGTLLAYPLQYLAIQRAIPGWRLRMRDMSGETLRMILGYSSWMLLKKMSGLMVEKSDKIILGLMLPIASLTVYQVVLTPFRYIREFSFLFNSAVTPAVSASDAQHGRGSLDRYIYLLSRYSNAFVAPLGMAGIYLAGPFVELWMGPEYATYAWIAQLACAFVVLGQANQTLSKVLYGSGHVRRITVLTFLLAILNLPLGVWWTAEVGVAGVVLATIFVGLASIPLQYLWVLPELSVHRGRFFVETVLRGQGPSWLLGLALLPFWGRLQAIDSWAGVIAVGAGILVAAGLVNWIVVVEPVHRAAILRRLRSLARRGTVGGPGVSSGS